MSANKVNIAPASEETLKKLDWIIVIDHSGSTDEPSKRMQGTRYDEMKEYALQAARVAGRYDDDGITLIHFSSNVVVKDGVTADSLADVFKEYRPGGMTNLGLALGKAVDKARHSTKEVVCIVYTDGAATDPERVLDVINQAGKEFGRPRIGFCFVQVGHDPDASKFLDYIDNNLKVDVSATFNTEDADGLTVEQLVNAARTE